MSLQLKVVFYPVNFQYFSRHGSLFFLQKMSSASLRIRAGFSPVNFESFFRPSSIQKGLHLIKHVLHVEEIKSPDGAIVISGKCIPQASINKDPYRVEINLNSKRDLIFGHCNCVSGISGQCKHVAALISFVNHERTVSCTDTKQTWQKPSELRQSLYPKGETIESLFKTQITEPPTYSRSASAEHFLELLNLHKQTDGMLYKSLTIDVSQAKISEDSLAKATPNEQTLLNIFDNTKVVYNAMTSERKGLKVVLRKQSQTLQGCSSEFFENHIAKDIIACRQIFCETLEQSNNCNWFLQRKTRISASRAHKILRGCKIETRLNYFLESPPVMSAMQYGLDTEKKAKERYTEISNNLVESCGVIIKPNQPWLCATPDGILSDGKTTLEIKCPKTCENKAINVDYIKNCSLVRNHSHYTQVQLQMYVANAEKCHFFVFSEADSVLIEIPKDEEFL